MGVGGVRQMGCRRTLLAEVGSTRKTIACEADAVPGVLGLKILHTVATLYRSARVEEEGRGLGTSVDVDRIL